MSIEPEPLEERATERDGNVMVTQAWSAVATWPGRFYAAKRSRTTSQKVSGGCLSFMIFGLAFVIVPLAIVMVVEAVLVVWALLVTLVWLVGTGVSKLKVERSGTPRS